MNIDDAKPGLRVEFNRRRGWMSVGLRATVKGIEDGSNEKRIIIDMDCGAPYLGVCIEPRFLTPLDPLMVKMEEELKGYLDNEDLPDSGTLTVDGKTLVAVFNEWKRLRYTWMLALQHFEESEAPFYRGMRILSQNLNRADEAP